MANYTINAGERGANNKSLAANTEDVVSFAAGSRTSGYRNVEINNHPGSSGTIWATVDGTTATVAGAHTIPVFPGQSVQLDVAMRGASAVHLISSATATYSVVDA